MLDQILSKLIVVSERLDKIDRDIIPKLLAFDLLVTSNKIYFVTDAGIEMEFSYSAVRLFVAGKAKLKVRGEDGSP